MEVPTVPAALVCKDKIITNCARQGDNYVIHIIPRNLSQHPLKIDPEIPDSTDARIKQRG